MLALLIAGGRKCEVFIINGIFKMQSSRFLGISYKTLYNKIAAFSNPDNFKKYSNMSETQLDTIV